MCIGLLASVNIAVRIWAYVAICQVPILQQSCSPFNVWKITLFVTEKQNLSSPSIYPLSKRRASCCSMHGTQLIQATVACDFVINLCIELPTNFKKEVNRYVYSMKWLTNIIDMGSIDTVPCDTYFSGLWRKWCIANWSNECFPSSAIWKNTIYLSEITLLYVIVFGYLIWIKLESKKLHHSKLHYTAATLLLVCLIYLIQYIGHF